MYVITKYSPEIYIELENGIYIFDNESATGKTRLSKFFKKLKAYGEPVDSFTYDDLLRGESLEKVLHSANRVILLDRYDLYKEKGHDLINACARDSIILIDCKTAFRGSTEDQSCFINMTEDKIEVSE